MAKHYKKRTYKKRYKKRKGASKSKKIAKGNAFLVNPRSNIGAFPQMYKTHMRYCETVGLTSANGIIGNHVWSSTNMEDPNVTGTGHQPLYFDQCMLIWFQYVVTGCTLRAEFTWPTDLGSIAGSVIVGVHLDENSTIDFLGADSMREENRVK